MSAIVPQIGPPMAAPCIKCGKMLDEWTIKEGRQFRDLKHFAPSPPLGKSSGPYCHHCLQRLFQEPQK